MIKKTYLVIKTKVENNWLTVLIIKTETEKNEKPKSKLTFFFSFSNPD